MVELNIVLVISVTVISHHMSQSCAMWHIGAGFRSFSNSFSSSSDSSLTSLDAPKINDATSSSRTAIPSSADELTKAVLTVGPSLPAAEPKVNQAYFTTGPKIPSPAAEPKVNQAFFTTGPKIPSPAAEPKMADLVLGPSFDLPPSIELPRLESEHVFETIQENVKRAPEILKEKVGGVIVGEINKNKEKAETWTADLTNGLAYKGEPNTGIEPTTRFQVEDATLKDIASGKLNPRRAYLQGNFIIHGKKPKNIGLLIKQQKSQSDS